MTWFCEILKFPSFRNIAGSTLPAHIQLSSYTPPVWSTPRLLLVMEIVRESPMTSISSFSAPFSSDTKNSIPPVNLDSFIRAFKERNWYRISAFKRDSSDQWNGISCTVFGLWSLQIQSCTSAAMMESPVWRPSFKMHRDAPKSFRKTFMCFTSELSKEF